VAVAPEFALRVQAERAHEPPYVWHVGGPAEVFFNARDRADLAAFLKTLPGDVPIQWVGLGSNLLVRDGGIKGVVISTVGTLDRLDRLNQTTVYCEAGVACARIAKQCVKWGGPGRILCGNSRDTGGALGDERRRVSVARPGPRSLM